MGILTSGFLAKMVLGAVALAAIGGVAVNMPDRQAEESPPSTSATSLSLLQPGTPAVETVIPAADQTPAAAALIERAYAYAEAVQTWGDCVSAAARDHSGGAFDPRLTCGDSPSAADHGFADRPPPANRATAPGHTTEPAGNSATAPGHTTEPPGNRAK